MGGRKVLVIDVDETLLNIEPLFFLKRFRKDYIDYKGINFSDMGREYYVVSRPRVKEALEIAGKNFDLVAFSVVDRDITEQKLNMLGLRDFFVKIYGREDLIRKKKSLKKISEDFGAPIGDIIAIDDRPELFYEREQVIPLKPFFMGKDTKYEFIKKSDNLFGAINQALSIKQGIKIASSVN